jgi:phosphoribosylanthranilate isomerase
MRVKICGITSVADAVAVARLGADAVGLNLYPPSPRFVADRTALEITRGLPPFVEAVGLFVNVSPDAVAERLASLPGIASVQWHGEDPVAGFPWPCRFVPAFPIAGRDDLRRVEDFVARSREFGHPPTAVLVDARVPGEYGGTGRTAPWDLLAGFDPGVPLVLAGGLTPENVAEAVRTVRPYAVDVASGVESSPGRKDPDKVRRFIENARAAGG